MDASQVIIRPVVSEKSYVLADGRQVHVPRPRPTRTRPRSARPSRQLFDVNVVEVRTAYGASPSPSAAATPPGARAAWKKAIVQVRAGRHDPDLPGPGGPARTEPMPIRKPKPTSPGPPLRRPIPDFAEITKTEPEKSLVEGLKKSGGRNAHGRKTSRHRGGGAKRLYRKIDFKRRKDGVPAKVAAIEYDPNRSAYIALLHYVDGEKRYILAPQPPARSA